MSICLDYATQLGAFEDKEGCLHWPESGIMVVSELDRGRDAINVRPPDTEGVTSMLNQSTTRIPLTRGRYALVDSADYSRVAGFRWHCTGNGYVKAQIRGSRRRASTLLHRLILDAPGGMEVDHIDGDPLNNRRANLRLVTRSENLQNRHRLSSSNRSGFRGAAWMPSVGRYRARVGVGGKEIHLGLFDTLEEAAAAAREGRRKYMTHSSEAHLILQGRSIAHFITDIRELDKALYDEMEKR